MGIFDNLLKKNSTSSLSKSSVTSKPDISWVQLNAILSGIHEAVIVIDANHKILLVNKAGEELLGASESSLPGVMLSQIVRLYKNNAEITRNVCGSAFSDDRVKLVSQIPMATKKELTVSIACTQIETGEWVITMRDVSIDRQLEEMKMGFVSIAAHELRTPLTSIKGYLSVFMGDYKDKLNDDQKDLLNHIAASTDQLLSLVENLLNVSRVERGAVELSLENLDLVVLAKQIIDEFRSRAVEKNIELSLGAIPSDACMVRIDKVRLGEVLSNLLSNAITYTDPNGKIIVSIEKTASEIITHVTDTGKGIPKEAIPHLFTKFFRVTSNALTQSTEGNGLGLYISKAIIDMHHGKIWVDSPALTNFGGQEGKGSTFSFSLQLF